MILFSFICCGRLYQRLQIFILPESIPFHCDVIPHTKTAKSILASTPLLLNLGSVINLGSVALPTWMWVGLTNKCLKRTSSGLGWENLDLWYTLHVRSISKVRVFSHTSWDSRNSIELCKFLSAHDIHILFSCSHTVAAWELPKKKLPSPGIPLTFRSLICSLGSNPFKTNLELTLRKLSSVTFNGTHSLTPISTLFSLQAQRFFFFL